MKLKRLLPQPKTGKGVNVAKITGTPAQIAAIESTFDELALLHAYVLEDWPELLPEVARQLDEPELYPPPLGGEPPGPIWIMQHLAWLVREEIESVKGENHSQRLEQGLPWWHESLSIALSLALGEELMRDSPPALQVAPSQEIFALWCLAESVAIPD